MRLTLTVAVLISSALANPYFDYDPASPETGVLVIWPTAKSTALAGAMTGLADEADATYFNPAGLAFQRTSHVDITFASWLPGLYPGMRYASVAGGAPLHLHFLKGRNVCLAASLTYLTVGEQDIVNEHGDFLGRVDVWHGTAGVHAGLAVTNTLGLGLGLKLVRSSYYDGWLWWIASIADWPNAAWEPTVNDAVTVAADLAVLYHPIPQVSVGAAIANLGPPIVYRPSGAVDDLPRMARLGLRWTPVESRSVRLRVMPELDKLLVGMFRDTTGKSFGRQLNEEWRDAWKALGIEATAFGLVSLRLGYFEDLTGQRGGFVLENKDGNSYHYGLWDALSRKGLGQLKSIGLCWGLGVGTDALRFDLSSDAAIYDFPTSNWKFQVTCNDIGRLLGKRG